jgi:hypothetical protein
LYSLRYQLISFNVCHNSFQLIEHTDHFAGFQLNEFLQFPQGPVDDPWIGKLVSIFRVPASEVRRLHRELTPDEEEWAEPGRNEEQITLFLVGFYQFGAKSAGQTGGLLTVLTQKEFSFMRVGARESGKDSVLVTILDAHVIAYKAKTSAIVNPAEQVPKQFNGLFYE